MCIIRDSSRVISYYTDKTTRDVFDELREKDKTVARINFKINNYNLLGEKVSKEYKAMKAKRLINKLDAKLQAFKAKDNSQKYLSSTTIPFFDIDFRSVMEIINKNNQEKIPRNKELQIFHKNIRLFERLFGFRFGNRQSLLAINNQSLVTLDNIYPEIKEFYDVNDFGNLLDSPTKIKPLESIDDVMAKNKEFVLLSSKSEIIKKAQGYKVKLLAGALPASLS